MTLASLLGIIPPSPIIPTADGEARAACWFCVPVAGIEEGGGVFTLIRFLPAPPPPPLMMSFHGTRAPLRKNGRLEERSCARRDERTWS